MSSASTARIWGILIGIAGATVLAIFGVVAFGLTVGWNQNNIKEINGVPPRNGRLTEAAGPGVSITPDPATSEITVANTGVLAALPGSGISISNPTGVITISSTGVTNVTAGRGVAVSSGTGNITVTNTGVLTLNNQTPDANGDVDVVPVNGIEVDTGPGSNQISVGYGINRQTTVLTDQDPNGTFVNYFVALGFFQAADENTWLMGAVPGYVPSPNFFPGAFMDSGQGDLGGAGWTIPSPGTYSLSCTCFFGINDTITTGDFVAPVVTAVFGATTQNPSSGIRPAGALQRTILNTNVNASVGAVAYQYLVSFNSIFQSCPTCLPPGDLTLHAMLEHTAPAPTKPLAFNADCFVTVGKLV